MIYRQKSNKNRTFLIFIVVLVIILVLFFADALLRKSLNNTAGNLFRIRDWVVYPFKSLGNIFHSNNYLISQNEALNEENKKLKIESLTTQMLRNENESLKKLIQNSVEVEGERIVSKVFQAPPSAPFDVLIIDAFNKNFQVGDKVYYGDLILGYVSEKYDYQALVKLLSSPDQKFQAKLKDEYDIEVNGNGNLSFVTSLQKDVNIEEGDVVTLPGRYVSILGVVQEVETPDSSTFQKIYFRFPLTFNELRYVEIRK